MKVKKSLFVISIMSLAFVFFSCATTSKEPASVEETSRVFWTVNGFDKKGDPSTVYLLGTMHVGDPQILNFPQEIMDALESSDRFVSEISSDDMAALANEMPQELIRSAMKAQGKNVYTYLNEEQFNFVKTILGENMEYFGMFEPWVLTTTLTSLQYESSGLTAQNGIDSNLQALLTSKEIKWDGLDTLQTQLDAISFGTYEEQLYILTDLIDSIIEPKEINEFINSLYNAYLNNNLEKIRELSEAELKCDNPEMQSFMDAYAKKLFNDRNENWAKKIAGYLSKGGKTFIFAGSGHFVGDNSVFNYLRKNGTIK